MRITLVPGADWMICAPCPYRNPELGLCVCGNIMAGGLYNEMKDLNVLQHLGLVYGTKMKARDLYRLILEKMPTVEGVCVLEYEGKSTYSVWSDGCHGKPVTKYLKGRELLLSLLT
jgi:hypothetical protein